MTQSTNTTGYDRSYQNDDLNPSLMFNTVATQLLVAIANNQINIEELVRENLAHRGLDLQGNWVGFKASKVILDDYKKELDLKAKRNEASQKSIAKKKAEQAAKEAAKLASKKTTTPITNAVPKKGDNKNVK